MSNQLKVQAPQELKRCATGDESEFVAALHEQKVRDANIERLKEVLRLIMLKVGLRAQNMPNDEEKAVLLSHIISNYGTHTPKEILLAFEMGMAGKLDVEMTTYENFSCLYFSNVMNAYRGWAKQTHRQVVKEVPPQIEHKEDLSEQAMSDWYQQVSKDLTGGMDLQMLPIMLYDWLDKKGKFNVDAKTKYAYMDKAAKMLKEQEIEPEMEKVKNLAKRIILNNYIWNEHNQK